MFPWLKLWCTHNRGSNIRFKDKHISDFQGIYTYVVCNQLIMNIRVRQLNCTLITYFIIKYYMTYFIVLP